MARKRNMELRKKIIACLKRAYAEDEPLWVNEISRRTGIAHSTVSLILDDMSVKGMITDINPFREAEGMHIKLRMVKLKDKFINLQNK